MLSIKSECLNRMMFFGEASWRRAVGEYLQHYHRERPHQGRGNETLDSAPRSTEGEFRCTERLGGLLKHYGFDLQMCPVVEDLQLDEELVELD